MARVVILGHGGFRQGDIEVLVPPNTSVTFYSDAGSNLTLPAIATAPMGSGWVEGVNCKFDYEKVRNVLDNFKSDKTVIGGGVVYNFHLQPASAESRAIAENLDWGGELVTPPSGEMKLCTGTAATCPTPALRKQMDDHVNGVEGAEDVPDERWSHSCDGLLAEYEGSEIFWVSCTGFSFTDPAIPPELVAPTDGPGI
jgi:hypothetical protein